LDGDGLDDLFVAGRASVSAWNLRERRRIWSLPAAGSFGAVTTARLRAGKGPDVVLVEQSKGTRALDGRTGETLWSAATGQQNRDELWSFSAKARIYDPLLLGDFDGDGRQDVVCSDESGNVTLVRAEPPDLLWKQAGVAWSLEAPGAAGNPPDALVFCHDDAM